jgi:hypothetical protein
MSNAGVRGAPQRLTAKYYHETKMVFYFLRINPQLSTPSSIAALEWLEKHHTGILSIQKDKNGLRLSSYQLSINNRLKYSRFG